MKVIIGGTRYVPERYKAVASETFSQLILDARQLSGESIKDAAGAIGISYGTLRKLEVEDSDPRLSTLLAVLDHYDIDFNEIKQAEREDQSNG